MVFRGTKRVGKSPTSCHGHPPATKPSYEISYRLIAKRALEALAHPIELLRGASQVSLPQQLAS